VIDFGEGNPPEKAIGFVAGTPGMTKHPCESEREWGEGVGREREREKEKEGERGRARETARQTARDRPHWTNAQPY
jgi:hypothetical protein